MIREAICLACDIPFRWESKPGRPPRVCSPECRAEDNRRRAKAWYKANPDRVAAQTSTQPEARSKRFQLWYAANRESEVQRSLRYQREHPEVKRAADMKRYALTRGAPEGESFTLDQIFERDRGVCHLCTQSVDRSDASVDHIIPVSKGGPHTRDNVALAHRRCNARKGNRLITLVS